MNTEELSTIGRPLDLNYPTNKSIVIITVILFIVFTLNKIFHGESIYISLLAGLRAGIIILLLWAGSRELDPDSELSAFVVVALGIIILVLSGTSQLIPFIWFLLVLRLITHTSGMHAGIIDSLLIAAIGLILTYNTSAMYGILTSIAFIADSRLKDPGKYHFEMGIIMFIASIIIYLATNGNEFNLTPEKLLLINAGVALFLPVAVKKEKIHSTGDKTGKVLDPSRIRIARIATIVIFPGISAIATEGNLSVMQFFFCIVAGIGLFHIMGKIHHLRWK